VNLYKLRERNWGIFTAYAALLTAMSA